MLYIWHEHWMTFSSLELCSNVDVTCTYDEGYNVPVLGSYSLRISTSCVLLWWCHITSPNVSICSVNNVYNNLLVSVQFCTFVWDIPSDLHSISEVTLRTVCLLFLFNGGSLWFSNVQVWSTNNDFSPLSICSNCFKLKLQHQDK